MVFLTLGLPGKFTAMTGMDAIRMTASVTDPRNRRATPLRPALPFALASALFLGWIVASCFYPLLGSDPYTWRTHLVSAGKFVEYVLVPPTPTTWALSDG